MEKSKGIFTHFFNQITYTILLIFFSSSLFAWQGFILADINYGNTDGFIQIPKGGSPGTTSFQRPNFSELDIQHSWFYEIGGGVEAHRYKLWFDYRYIKNSSDPFLLSPLKTHNQWVAANSPFLMKLSYDWYALILEKTLLTSSPKWEITPFLSANVIKTSYQFFAIDSQSSRSFAHFATNIGLNVEYFFTPLFSASLQGSTSIPISNLNIAFAQAKLRYQERMQHFVLQPFIAIGLLRLDLEDKQTIPNHVNFNLRPYGSLGFAILFPTD